jgi:hypothetical protein
VLPSPLSTVKTVNSVKWLHRQSTLVAVCDT